MHFILSGFYIKLLILVYYYGHYTMMIIDLLYDMFDVCTHVLLTIIRYMLIALFSNFAIQSDIYVPP